MAITPTGDNAALSAVTNSGSNPKGVLGKDDFMKLLLVQLQYQDPTAPMDTEKILTQTSQLATLEASGNIKKALENLAKSLGNSQQFATIAAIGKTADLGTDTIAHDEGGTTSFELYFPNDIQQGVVEISDSSGNIIGSIDVGTNPKGVYSFTWDGKTPTGNEADSGVYHVNARYADQSGTTQQTRLGAYPIESVRFDNGKTFLKLGSNYVPLDNIKEVY
ncbi:MAG: flagellar hook capping protein [Epsilonproteobacteria bacterium]|nr:flagellar hook capping protein [Campylobacterota bacterium]